MLEFTAFLWVLELIILEFKALFTDGTGDSQRWYSQRISIRANHGRTLKGPGAFL